MQTNPERALIASILISPAEGLEALDRLAIKPSDLNHIETRLMLAEILKMRDQGDPIEAAALSARMPEQHKAAPWEVTSEVGAPAADYYGQIVVKLATRSRLLVLSEQITKTATNPEADVEALIDQALLTLSQAQGQGLANKSETLREAASRLIDDLDNPPRFIPTPWPALNEVIGGLRPGAFYVIAARPGVGKSLIGLQLAEAIANPERPVALFSFEMNAEELATRALASKTGIETRKIDRRDLSEKEKERLAVAWKNFGNSLHLMATDSREVTQLRPALRTIRSNNGGKLGAVVVDYLGQLETKSASLYERVTLISGQLKRLAMELDVPVVAMAQLNRKAGERPGAPGLADLRDSGAIEQDADVVLMLSNDEASGKLVVTIQKNRQGPQGYLLGTIDRSTMTIKDLVKA